MIAMTQTLVEKCDLKKRRANNALSDEYGVESIDKSCPFKRICILFTITII